MPELDSFPPDSSQAFAQIQNEAKNALHQNFTHRIAVEMDITLRPLIAVRASLQQLLDGENNPQLVHEFLTQAKADADQLMNTLYRYWTEARILSGLPTHGDTGAALPLAVSIQRQPGTEDLPLPSYKTEGAAGMDLYAAVTEPVVLAPGERAAIPTGIAIAVPSGYEAQVRARSGLAKNHGIALVNAPGTIDSDYRGEVAVLLVNLGDAPFTINRGDRIAQMVIAPFAQVTWKPTATLEATERGAGGFGHTGRQL